MKQATRIGVDVSAKGRVCAMKHNGQPYSLARFSNDQRASEVYPVGHLRTQPAPIDALGEPKEVFLAVRGGAP